MLTFLSKKVPIIRQPSTPPESPRQGNNTPPKPLCARATACRWKFANKNKWLRTKRKTLENIIYFVFFVKLFQAPATTATFAQYMPKNKYLPPAGAGPAGRLHFLPTNFAGPSCGIPFFAGRRGKGRLYGNFLQIRMTGA
ncbi:MAG TPA: hypothetical protein PKJ59_09295 [Syntrophales bacterium]|jgi:hypothetical protein|nr:hypothetical protein [Deltaproteobacteria bacterium]HNZ35392.1 hypothetical protein [Syntrophales bacterium]HOF74500.1 hypothetical protein [Syntrophales bacterium]HOR32486.1 hypothetical protein [Syntrophales bacterium]HPV53572.1 hypothetical protein [Syntrophales bacterium]